MTRGILVFYADDGCDTGEDSDHPVTGEDHLDPDGAAETPVSL